MEKPKTCPLPFNGLFVGIRVRADRSNSLTRSSAILRIDPFLLAPALLFLQAPVILSLSIFAPEFLVPIYPVLAASRRLVRKMFFQPIDNLLVRLGSQVRIPDVSYHRHLDDPVSFFLGIGLQIDQPGLRK